MARIDVAGLAFCSFQLLPPPGRAGRKAMNLYAPLRGSFQLWFRRREASGNLLQGSGYRSCLFRIGSGHRSITHNSNGSTRSEVRPCAKLRNRFGVLASRFSAPNLLRPSGTRPSAAPARALAVFLAYETFCETRAQGPVSLGLGFGVKWL